VRLRQKKVAGCLAVLVAGVGLSACGGSDSDDSGPKTFESDAYPFTFEYPASFDVSDDVGVSQNLGGSTEDTTAVAIDDSNGIILQRATLNATVTEGNLGAAKRQFDALIHRVDPGASGKPGRIAGFPSLTYAAFALKSVPDGESQVTFLFDGRDEYVINCQSTPQERETIQAACDQALSTLKAA